MLKYRFVKVILLCWATVCLVLFSGCSQSDDVVSIFTGKKWKLTLVTEDDKNEYLNIWSSLADKEADLNSLRSNRDAYTIGMSGILEGDVISGDIVVVTISGTANGTWQANAHDRSLRIRITGAPSTTLEHELFRGLNSSFSYEGSDENNLYVRYSKDGRVCRLSFRVLK